MVGEVLSATLNDVELDVSTHADGRLPLPSLAAENVLVVSSVQTDTGSGNAILRSVDPQDKLVYVWTTFEPDGARHAWACFDQPDLKAVHGFQVSAPDRVDGAEQLRAGGGARPRRRRPALDLPGHAAALDVRRRGQRRPVPRDPRAARRPHLGLYCRQSLRTFLERDAEELFRLTEQGLAFFGERFELPFPQERYDQVFVPDFGGAMENWGCVTWTDAVLYRTPPTYAQRAWRGLVLLHEMAHMWFGDLVTMRWWDDLWLNEAFASFASTWASASATEYTDAWAAFLAERADRRPTGRTSGPASHPIRTAVPDVGARVRQLRRDHLRTRARRCWTS